MRTVAPLCTMTFFSLALVSPTRAIPLAYVTNASDNTVSVVDTERDAVVVTIPVGVMPRGVALDPNGTRVFVANAGDGSVSVIDASTNVVVRTIAAGRMPAAVAVNAQGTQLYIADGTDPGTVSAIDLATYLPTGQISVGRFLASVAADPHETRVYVASLFEPDESPCSIQPLAFCNTSVYAIDTVTNTAVKRIPVGNTLRGTAVDPAGQRLFVAGTALVNSQLLNVLAIVDLVRSNVTRVPLGPNAGEPIGVAINPTGTHAYVTADELIVVDIAAGTVAATIPVGGQPFGVSVNPSGTKVYLAIPNDDIVSVIDTATDSVSTTIPVGREPVAFGQFIAPDIPSATPTPSPSATPTGAATATATPILVPSSSTSSGSGGCHVTNSSHTEHSLDSLLALAFIMLLRWTRKQ